MLHWTMDFCTLTVCIKLRKQWPLFFPHGVIYGMIWFRAVTKAGQPLPLCTCMCLTGVYMCLTRVGKSLCMISNLPSLLLKLYTNPVPFLFFQIILNKQHKFWYSLQLTNSHIKMRKFMIPLLISAVPNLFLYTACLDQSTNEDQYLEIRIF